MVCSQIPGLLLAEKELIMQGLPCPGEFTSQFVLPVLPPLAQIGAGSCPAVPPPLARGRGRAPHQASPPEGLAHVHSCVTQPPGSQPLVGAEGREQRQLQKDGISSREGETEAKRLAGVGVEGGVGWRGAEGRLCWGCQHPAGVSRALKQYQNAWPGNPDRQSRLENQPRSGN